MSSDRKMPDDRELEDFLAGRHPVGKAYREASENETAPPELDVLILGAAREAVRTPRVRRPRWVQPVAIAATVTLSLGVLLNIWRDPEMRGQMAPSADTDLDRMKAQVLEEEQAPSPIADAKKEAAPSVEAGPAQATAEPAAAAAAEVERRSDAAAARREPAPLRDEQRKAKKESAPDTANAALSAGAAAPKAAAPMPAPQKPKAPEPESSTRSYGFVPEPPPAEVAAPPPPPAPPAPVVTAPSPGAQRAAPLGAAAGGLSSEDDRVGERMPVDERKDAKRSREITGSTSGGHSGFAEKEGMAAKGAAAPRAAPSTSTAAPTAAPASKAMQPEAESEAADHFAPAAPEEWILTIRELRDAGDENAARDLLKSFRSRYPDYVLPDDLRALARP